MRTIQDECSILQQLVPDFADILIEAIDAKHIDGGIYGCAGGPGAIYAHLGKFDLATTESLWLQVDKRMGLLSNTLTPMEELVADVSPGQGKEDTPALQQLYDLLRPYRTTSIEEREKNQ